MRIFSRCYDGSSIWSGWIVLALGMSVVSGCGGEFEDFETGQQQSALTVDTKIEVHPFTSRYLRITDVDVCKTVCLWWENDYVPGQRVCMHSERQCSPSQSVTLHADKMAASQDTIFPPSSAEWGDYKGCGIKAAQNVLWYFGNEISQSRIGWDVKVQKLLTGDIAVYPDHLEKGLRTLVNNFGGTKRFSIDRYTGKTTTDIIKHLRRGLPVVALVDGGTHWVVVTGYDPRVGFFVHDNWSGRWRKNWEMDLGFDPLQSLWGGLTTNDSYKPGTIITFTALPPAPPPPPAAPPFPGSACPSGQICCNPGIDSCLRCVPRSVGCSLF